MSADGEMGNTLAGRDNIFQFSVRVEFTLWCDCSRSNRTSLNLFFYIRIRIGISIQKKKPQGELIPS